MRVRLFWFCFYVLMLFKRLVKFLMIKIGVNFVLGGKKRFGELRLLFVMCVCNMLLRRLYDILVWKVFFCIFNIVKVFNRVFMYILVIFVLFF